MSIDSGLSYLRCVNYSMFISIRLLSYNLFLRILNLKIINEKDNSVIVFTSTDSFTDKKQNQHL